MPFVPISTSHNPKVSIRTIPSTAAREKKCIALSSYPHPLTKSRQTGKSTNKPTSTIQMSSLLCVRVCAHVRVAISFYLLPLFLVTSSRGIVVAVYVYGNKNTCWIMDEVWEVFRIASVCNYTELIFPTKLNSRTFYKQRSLGSFEKESLFFSSLKEVAGTLACSIAHSSFSRESSRVFFSN